jgi:hypothetical protein
MMIINLAERARASREREYGVLFQIYFSITLILMIIKNMLKKRRNNGNSLTINGKNTHLYNYMIF